jgi:Second Messenger Oligonucleotide or Dinucleotide Synthetase domain
MTNLWQTPPFGASSILQPQASPFTATNSYVGSWLYVRRRFRALHSNLQLTPEQTADGKTKYRGVVSALNRNYWGTSSETNYLELVGSWAKGTPVRPPRDVDFIFELPVAVYHRFEQRTGNKQSQLLQEVRDVLSATYPQTAIRGDGQVVVIPFNTYGIEVAPGFPANGGGYLICDTNNGGRYKWVHPAAELTEFNAFDARFAGNVRKLSQMLKQWQRHCNVPIKSFQIEALVKETLAHSTYGASDEFWFDWLVRDVFEHILQRSNGTFYMPATGEMIFLGDEWFSKAESAYGRARKACDFEFNNNNEEAGDEWQKIFGTMIPQAVG